MCKILKFKYDVCLLKNGKVYVGLNFQQAHANMTRFVKEISCAYAQALTNF